MLLKEWMAFNKPFINCDFQVAILKRKSLNKNDTLLEAIIDWDMCERFFGNLEIIRLAMGVRSDLETPCFRLILWEIDSQKEQSL